uniref:Uncharacterized protein n=1 Tax=Arundo donax TaxID=35708 RepID=A0A0A8ZR97_ARUDO
MEICMDFPQKMIT